MARRSVALIGGLLLAILATAAPAGAAGPAMERIDDELVLSGAPCGGFTYDIALHGRGTRKFFSDRITEHWNWDGYAQASTGTTVRVHHAFNVEVDLVAGTVTFTGLGFGSWAEGSRVLYRGRLVLDLDTDEDLFKAGRHPDVFNPHQDTCDLIAAAQA